MVDTKKPAQPAPATTTAKPAATTTTRAPLPSLSPLAEAKPTAASIQPAAPAGTTAAPEKTAQPASAPAEANAAPSPEKAAKPTESLAPKLRTKADILAALRKGARVQHTESGLYRIVEVNGTVHPASKRRVVALLDQKILTATDADKRVFVLDTDAEKKASEKKPVAVKPEAPATAPVVKDAK